MSQNDEKLICARQFIFSSGGTLKTIFVFYSFVHWKTYENVCKVLGKYDDLFLIYELKYV